MSFNIKQKYQSLSQPVKASLWFTVCNAVQKGISLVSTPIFTRMLTPEQYGVYTVYQSWYAIISIIATLNLSYGVFNNGMSKYPEDRPRFVSSMQGLSITATLIVSIVYFAGMNFWSRVLDLAPVLMIAMLIELVAMPSYLYWSAEQRYNYKYRKLVAVTVIMAVASPLLGIAAVYFSEFKAEARIISYVAVQAIVGFAFMIYIFARKRTFFDKEYWKFGLRFNIPLIPHYLSTQILSQADRIMIKKMVSDSKAAIYGVANTVSMMMIIVTSAINNSFIPFTYKELKEHRYDSIRRTANFLLILVGGACILAMAFCPEIIRIFAAPEYYEAIWVMPPIAAAVYFMFLYPLFANIEFYFEKTGFVAVASSIAAVTNLVLNYIFINRYGYYAAGYTTLICYIVYSGAHYLFHLRVIRKNIPDVKQIYNMKFVLLMSVVVIGAMLLMLVLYRHMIIRYVVIAALLLTAFLMRKRIMAGLKALKNK